MHCQFADVALPIRRRCTANSPTQAYAKVGGKWRNYAILRHKDFSIYSIEYIARRTRYALAGRLFKPPAPPRESEWYLDERGNVILGSKRPPKLLRFLLKKDGAPNFSKNEAKKFCVSPERRPKIILDQLSFHKKCKKRKRWRC